MEKHPTKRKPGRPPLESGKKTRILRTRLSEEDYRQLAKQLDAAGITVSEWIRKRLLSPHAATPVNTADLLDRLDTIGAELGRSGNNINQLARHANVLRRYGMLTEPVVRAFLPLLETYLAQQRELGNQLRSILRLLARQ